jgi:hypothetical protein
LDRSDWKVRTQAEAICAARAALKAINSPSAEASFVADLLEYVDDGVWLVVPAWGAPEEVDVSVTVDVRSGSTSIGSYSRATINEDLGQRE